MQSVLIGVLLCCALVVIVELSSRAWLGRQGYFVFTPRSRHIFELDAEALPQLPSPVTISINSDGERGEEFRGDENTFRVLVAGGSAAQCLFVDQAGTWPTLIAEHLKAPDALHLLGRDRVHVGSIGKSGIHLACVKHELRLSLPRYRHLDAIVLMIGAGDPLRWVATGAPEQGLAEPTMEECFAEHPERTFSFSPRASATAAVLRRIRSRYRPERRERVGRWMKRARNLRNNSGDLRVTITDPSRMVADYEAALVDVLAIAKAKARHVLLVRQPWYQKDELTAAETAMFWNFGVESPTGEMTDTFYGLEVAEDLLQRIDASSVRIAQRAGVADLDVMAVLSPSPDNYYDQFHFTALGNGIVGAAVAEALLNVIRENGSGS